MSARRSRDISLKMQNFRTLSSCYINFSSNDVEEHFGPLILICSANGHLALLVKGKII